MSADEKDDEDLDGVPLDGAALLKGVLMRGLPDKQKTTPLRSQEVSRDAEYNDDIDGIPSKILASLVNKNKCIAIL